jgi:hypothetical protein
LFEKNFFIDSIEKFKLLKSLLIILDCINLINVSEESRLAVTNFIKHMSFLGFSQSHGGSLGKSGSLKLKIHELRGASVPTHPEASEVTHNHRSNFRSEQP